LSNDSDRAALASAYTQAIYAVGNSDPNPAVGAIITDAQGRTLAAGYTQRAGYAHAERHALSQLELPDLSGHTIYVTLEPCCHHGRTPPCVDAIVERQLRRVVIAERDFAAEVQGRSVSLLRAAGIEVVEWPAEDFQGEKWFTTGPFFFARRHDRPRVVLKWAQTKDGSTAPQKGKSGQISGSDAAFITATLRFMFKLTVASPGTVLVDAPRLTVRTAGDFPDLSQSGLSSFVWELLRLQYQLASKPLDPETVQQKIRPPKSLFLLPDTMAGFSAELPTGHQETKQSWRTKAIPYREWQQDFPGTWKSVLAEISDEGYNSLMLEAGPSFSEAMLQHDLADALVIYRSRVHSDRDLWGTHGRGNQVSRILAKEGAPTLPGFELLEFARLDQDDFLLFVRTDR
jgi:diaminohydroxyphosphoribosylaminopyrimidine deaminase/5-amino-6-(5-phosphoribosylamino)uracil reductase